MERDRAGLHRWLMRATAALCVLSGAGLLAALSLADRPRLAALVGCAVVFLSALVVFVVHPFGREPRHYWICSAAVSALCLAGLVGTWHLVHEDDHHVVIGAEVTSTETTDAYLAQELPRGSNPWRVPTGVYLESIQFANSNEVKVSGYVWQRYSDEIPASVARGVVLPEADDSYPAKQAYRHREPGAEVIGWYFKTAFVQKFDYTRYPLDRQDVWIRMWHPDLDRRVVLTPDFGAYPRPWEANAMHGLDPQFVTARWQPQSTLFSYSRHDYTTNFGQGRYADRPPFPELYFNLLVSRQFHGPLFETLVPTGFIAVLVFAALFVTTRGDELRRTFVGFTSFGVISFAVSMVLVVAVRQNAIREATAAPGIVYLEYYSFVLYLVVLLSAINALLVTARNPTMVVRWRDNLLPRIAYWPVLFGFSLAATLYTLG
ncbi:hypothetical protein NLX83_11155 [Allokutzneria sp. A3M-2-11 16]|uniref:hypothetical protein n=1 Tax=Allokutzneria sp. A3M-2-11 16 TaxID=2962043 RepID=UPI0020B6F2BA|nr:hypothetical protein [Allokutzneria sp. A3M-2-11 16]MCP3799813.1 hypothetical protein [Allokutzneria sp. A3M-2-11 16]